MHPRVHACQLENFVSSVSTAQHMPVRTCQTPPERVWEQCTSCMSWTSFDHNLLQKHAAVKIAGLNCEVHGELPGWVHNHQFASMPGGRERILRIA
ncbi:hypothetical protein DUNSADRAFT_12543 [Dunaliella salina]|uniref:Uncharacterized protein n=1 Tax=Dunaliella salina TaxID=3046 RepID=A0ABQ7GB52_DUNSA|nr:hypothetical protein DUNSADRAFT_12543 [Dunaliella salina]|eukprot:KAF5831829.1 hypothetical protein DUNSADRAFT_12543 [Dunaliella salina]